MINIATKHLNSLPVPSEDIPEILHILLTSKHIININTAADVTNDNVKDYTNVSVNGLLCLKYLGRKHKRSIWLTKCLNCNTYHVTASGSLELRKLSNHRKCYACKGYKHTDSRTPFCKQWYRMRDKCLNETSPSFKANGAKGITISEEWKVYDNFKKDMFDSYAVGMRLKLKSHAYIYSKDTCYWEV